MSNNGASIKNFYLYNRLKQYIETIVCIDTEQWRKRPWVIIKLLGRILIHRKCQIIISTSNTSAYRLINLINKINSKALVFYWVIGGSLGTDLVKGKWPYAKYRSLKRIIVEGTSMQRDLNKLGLDNCLFIPNFKNFDKEIVRKHNENQDIVRFVFLSRIVPYKGSEVILEAVKYLNDRGYNEQFEIDFYGPFEPGYKQEFCAKANSCGNVSYKGFIDLRKFDNYTILSEYDFMLFPTYWESEGCPGIILDAYYAGIPIIATDWNLNSDYVLEGVTGMLVQGKNPVQLALKMKAVLDHEIDVKSMKKNALAQFSNYKVENVLSKENLERVGIKLNN